MPYFDHAATTFLSKEVIEAMTKTMETYNGNPSSLHEEGISARKYMNQLKNSIAKTLNTSRKSLLFTGSGTEASNLAIKGFYYKHKKARFITSTVEHHASLNTFKFLSSEGADVDFVAASETGQIDFEALKSTLSNSKHNFVSLIYINNELGTKLDLDQLVKILKPYQYTLHLDMVQAPLHEKIDLEKLSIDMASMSAHKFHGPKGIGLLYIKDSTKIESLIHGGKQEFSKRAGTESLMLMSGLEKALTMCQENLTTHNTITHQLAEHLLTCLEQKNIVYRLNGEALNGHRVSAILNLGFKAVEGDVLQFQLNRLGHCVSLGSACDSDNIEPSHVLKATHVPKDFIKNSIRISLSHVNTLEEVSNLANDITNIIEANK